MWLPPNLERASDLKCLRAFQIAFWVPTGAALIMLAVVQLQPRHWQHLVLGTVFIIAGSAGSQLLPEWKKHKWLKWIRAAFIAIVIALGALLTTHGWNERDNYLYNRALMFATVAEWKLNDWRFQQISFIRKRMESNSLKVFHQLNVPTNRDISRIVTSSSSVHVKTGSLGLLAMEYVYDTDRLALAIDAYNTARSSAFTTGVTAQHFKNIFADTGPYDPALDVHRRLGDYVETHYGDMLERFDALRVRFGIHTDAPDEHSCQ